MSDSKSVLNFIFEGVKIEIMDFIFNYEVMTLEECYSYEHYDLICDGDDKKIKILRSEING